jgi:hypothetical protein
MRVERPERDGAYSPDARRGGAPSLPSEGCSGATVGVALSPITPFIGMRVGPLDPERGLHANEIGL